MIKLAALDAALNPLLARFAQHVELPGAIRPHREPGIWGYTVLQYEQCHRLWPINVALTAHPPIPTNPTLDFPHSETQTPLSLHLAQPRSHPTPDRKCMLA